MTLAAHGAGDPFAEHGALPQPRLRRLDGAFLGAAVDEAARSLLGVLVVRDDETGRRVGRIVETEAYGGPEDRASHARAGRTRRTAVMFGTAGRAYVYLVYGLHHCLNVVCGADGQAAAVLVRAVEPIEGIGLMRARRGAGAGPDHRLAAGPARLCQALDIDGTLDGSDLLTGDRLWLATAAAGSDDDASNGRQAQGLVAGPRIGVGYAGPDWGLRPWRFGIAGHASLSRPFPSPG